VKTLDRIEILRDLREGVFDVLVGVNLLREGLDLPEVSLVAIMDADKEGFLRSNRSLTQTAGRAARNVNGKVIMYADKITGSMQTTMDETDRRREKQVAHNIKHGIVPQQINKKNETLFENSGVVSRPDNYSDVDTSAAIAADPLVQYMNSDDLQKAIQKTQKAMEKAAKDMEFMEAARLRDELIELKKLYESKK
jgi:excinuclease ABC subunit B